MNRQNQKFVERIESELLFTLFSYAVPFIDKKIKPAGKEKRESANLENIVNNQKPKISFGDVRELEAILLKNLSDSVKINRSAGVQQNNLFYSLNLRRQKNRDDKSNNYSLSIKYEETQQEEKIKISIQQSQKEPYQIEITNKKDAKDNVAPYKITINYEDNYAEERLAIAYKQQLRSYLQKHIEDKEDMTNRVPLKWLNILPETMMGGVLGFTYLGENFMTRRADLTGKTARMVDIHESIHTPDEYETRVLTSWIMEKAKMRYVK